MKNKLTLILCLLLVPAIAYPWAGQSIVDVLVQLIDSDVQVDSLGVGCAPSGVSGEAKIGTILPCDDSSANVMRLPSGSSSSDILQVQDAAGSPVLVIRDNNTSYIQFLNVISRLQTDQIRPYTVSDDLVLQLRDDTKAFLFQNSSSNDTFTFSLDGDDRVMSFIGGTKTGVLTWDDSADEFLYDSHIRTTQNYYGTLISLTGSAILGGNVRSAQGYYGTDSNTPAAFPKGANYPEQTAPSAPSSGATLYTSSADGNLCAKRADGYQMCFGLPSFGKIFEENDTGSAITITVAGTYYPWITAEDGTGTGSTGGNTITTSTGNPSSITIEENGEGFYQVAWHAGIDTESGAVVHGAIFKNGSRILPTTNHVENATGATKDVAMSASTYVYLVENDVLTLQFTSDTNGDVVDVFHASLSCNRIAIEDNN